jgi:very-short-patch-repair endonuclease
MFIKINEENEIKEMEYKDEKLCDKVNEFLNYEIKDFIYGTNLILSGCESPIEQIFALVFNKISRLPYWITRFDKKNIEIFEIEKQININKYRVDFLISVVEFCEKPKFKKSFVIELDGHDFHEKTKEQVKKDKEKDRFLTSEGYVVVRFTGSEIYNEPHNKVKELLELILKLC